MKDYKNPRELLEYIQKAAELNPDYTTQEILEAALERGDTLGGVKVTDIIEQNDDFATSLVEAINKPAKEIDLSGLDLSFEEPKEKSDIASAIESEGETPIEAKEIGSDNNFEVFKNFWERYKQLHGEKKNLIEKYNGGVGYPEGSDARKDYETKLKIYNDALNEMEDGEEFYNIMKSIKDYGLGGEGGVIPERVAMAMSTIIDKEYSQDNDKKGIMRGILGNDYVDSWNAGHSFDLSRGDIDKVIDNYLGSHKTKSSGGENADIKGETKGNNKGISVNNSPLRPTKITDEKVTDEMSFGDDVAGQGGEEYLKKRNIALATHLKQKGIETPEEIEEYLSKYPSWKNAKQERKDNTINNLTEKMATMKGPEVKKDETKDETKKEKGENRDVNDDKGRLNKRLEEDKGTKDKASTRYDKDKKRLGDDWQPDNDSSINGIDEGENNKLRVQQYLDKGYKIKNGKFYTPSGVLVEQNGNNLSDKGERVPVNKSKDKLETAKDWNDFWNNDNESPLNGEEDDVIYTNEGKTKQGTISGNQQKEIKEKDTIQEHAAQNPSNNKYLWLDEEVKNLETNEERKKYLEEKGYKVNKDGYYERNGTKTRVYKDGQYNPKEVKSDNGLYTKPAPRNNEIQIRLQEQGYKGPKDKNGNFIPMNEDTLNGAGDKEETKETKKSNSSPLRKSKKETKKENKKVSMKDIIKVVKSSPTIKNLLKNSKK